MNTDKRKKRESHLVSCFNSNGKNHCLTVLTCWYRGAPNNVVQVDGSGGSPFSIPYYPTYIWSEDKTRDGVLITYWD